MGVFFVLEDNKTKTSRLLALSMLDDIRDFCGANFGLEEFLEFGTIDVRRQTAHKELSLLKLFRVLAETIFFEFLFALDGAILEHVIREGKDRIIGLLI